MTSLLSIVMGSGHGEKTICLPDLPSRRSVIGVVPLDSVDERAREALSTALSMAASRVVAVHVCRSVESARAFTRSWEEWEPGVPLVLLDRLETQGDPVAASIADYLGRRHTAYRTLVVVAEDPAPVSPARRASARGDALEEALLPLPHVVVCRQRPTTIPVGPSRPHPTAVPDSPDAT
jgi:hypothetical protein